MAERVEFRGDQAEGLRRMLDQDRIGPHSPTRIITLESACNGVGKTTVAVNLAAVLAARGLRVLLIDENRGPANINASFGLMSPVSLEQDTRPGRVLENAMSRMANGVAVLSVSGAPHRLIADLLPFESRYDVVLVDTHCGRADAADPFAGTPHDTIIVSSAATHAVTASYALIKRLRSVGEQRRFHVLLNRVVAEANAQVILDNLTGVARSYLQTPVASLGCVPRDDSLRCANAGFCPVVEAHPSSPSAARFRGIADCIAGWPGSRSRHHFMDRLMGRLFDGGPLVFTHAGV